MPDFSDIQSIRNFKGLIRYLRTQLDWPVDEDQADDLTFDYQPEELGLDEQYKVKVREIKQIRPLVDGQPWGIFWIDFDLKRLPVVVMRRILAALVKQKRATRKTRQATWDLHDLMFISATGQSSERGISFAHFRDMGDGQPQLRTFSWDVHETHLYYIKNLNLAALRWPTDPTNADAWRAKWAAAFTSGHREVIRTSEALAGRMAQLADATRHAVNESFGYERPNGPLHKLYESFRRVLIHDLSVDDFADMYAQTVTYGLFSARATRTGTFALENVVGLIPNTNPFLRDLLAECLKVSQGTGRAQIDLDELGVDELVETLANTDIEAVLRDWGRQRRGEDPVIHFYESFLNEYDAAKKVERGVFYTPDPIVSFIVRSVDYLLRNEFGCADGLADTSATESNGVMVPRVQVLDPATGTGTFLKYVIEQIHEIFTEKHKRLSAAERKRRWNEYVPQHLLPRLYGFELMMAPYSVAHMKLGLELKQTEYEFGADERLRVYLTNTLQAADEIPRVDTAYLAHEAAQANVVKTEDPIFVVLGNPPYAGNSSNANKNADGTLNFIGRLLRDYYFVDGKPLGEKNPKWLQDDYVKFLRWSQWRVEQTGAGIVAMITNHGYIDNPTFRGMRQQLMKSFTDIYILDLHGSLKKREVSPDGSIDQNVFDILPGVAICVLVRRPAERRDRRVWHADLYGTREHKYNWLMTECENISKVNWNEVVPQGPFYLFTPQDISLKAEFDRGWRLTEAMPVNVLGFQTHRDDFAISFDDAVMRSRILEMRDNRLTDHALAEKYQLKDNRDWQVANARILLRRTRNWDKDLLKCLYRPFDWRACYFSEVTMDYPRRELKDHVARRNNLCLLSSRQQGIVGYQHCWVSREPANDCVVSTKSREANQVFPLYLYPEGTATQNSMFALTDVGPNGQRPNLAAEFVREISLALNWRFILDGAGDLITTVGPEDVFDYIYGVLHSPTYRTRYAEFLKGDFPRIPVTRNRDLFRTLAGKGHELVSLHVFNSPALAHTIVQLSGQGNNTVESGYPTYENSTVWINESQGFQRVPDDVWELVVGGYQVAHKWLKDRRGRPLSADDQIHYAKIITALAETIRLMGEIDEAIPSWPIE